MLQYQLSVYGINLMKSSINFFLQFVTHSIISINTNNPEMRELSRSIKRQAS